MLPLPRVRARHSQPLTSACDAAAGLPRLPSPGSALTTLLTPGTACLAIPRHAITNSAIPRRRHKHHHLLALARISYRAPTPPACTFSTHFPVHYLYLPCIRRFYRSFHHRATLWLGLASFSGERKGQCSLTACLGDLPLLQPYASHNLPFSHCTAPSAWLPHLCAPLPLHALGATLEKIARACRGGRMEMEALPCTPHTTTSNWISMEEECLSITARATHTRMPANTVYAHSTRAVKHRFRATRARICAPAAARRCGTSQPPSLQTSPNKAATVLGLVF